MNRQPNPQLVLTGTDLLSAAQGGRFAPAESLAQEKKHKRSRSFCTVLHKVLRNPHPELRLLLVFTVSLGAGLRACRILSRSECY